MNCSTANPANPPTPAFCTEMKIRRWTPEEDALLREHYPKGGVKAVQQHLPHRNANAIYNRSQLLSSNLKRHWTAEEHALLMEVYPEGGWKAVQEYLPARNHRAIISRAARHGIKAPRHLRGQGGRFEKGNVPLNKGKPMPEHIKEKCKHTFFKPGRPCPRTLPVGSRRFNHHHGTWLIKVSNDGSRTDNWKQEHRVIYERHHNVKLSRDDKILHRNGDRTDNRIENLMRITLDEILAYGRDQLAAYPADVQQAIRALGEFSKRIKRRGRKS